MVLGAQKMVNMCVSNPFPVKQLRYKPQDLKLDW